MSNQISRKWDGEEAEILRTLLKPGSSVSDVSEMLGRFGLKVLDREKNEEGYSITLRHPAGAVARIHTNGDFIVQRIEEFEEKEAEAIDRRYAFRMHPEDRAHIENIPLVGVNRWGVMVSLDQPNYKFTVLENTKNADGGDRYVLQGKLFGLLVLDFDNQATCTSYQILEHDAAIAERVAIAQRNALKSH